jgi:hypothetical protein
MHASRWRGCTGIHRHRSGLKGKRTIPADPTNGNMAHMIKQWQALPGGEGVTIKLAKRLRSMG